MYAIRSYYDFIRVQKLAMTEDVHEKGAFACQPTRDPLEQRLVVAHMLEHLDRYRAVEAMRNNFV